MIVTATSGGDGEFDWVDFQITAKREGVSCPDLGTPYVVTASGARIDFQQEAPSACTMLNRGESGQARVGTNPMADAHWPSDTQIVLDTPGQPEMVWTTS
jgi:hypothetical protein